MPAFALFFAPLDGRPSRASCSRASGSAPSVLLRRWRAARGREVILPLLFLPLAIPLVVGGVGAGISPEGDLPVVPRPLRLVFAILAWATFEYVVTE